MAHFSFENLKPHGLSVHLEHNDTVSFRCIDRTAWLNVGGVTIFVPGAAQARLIAEAASKLAEAIQAEAAKVVA